MKNLRLPFGLVLFALLLLTSCKDETCDDGTMNQDETGVDCGGVCDACPTCSDGIKNQGETGVDCGGPCNPCSVALCTNNQFAASVAGSAYTASFISTNVVGGDLVINGSNVTTHSINLFIDTSMTTGTYNISGSTATSTVAGGQYGELNVGPNLYQATSGTLVISNWNKSSKSVTGTFSFSADQQIGGSATVAITSGSFCVNY